MSATPSLRALQLALHGDLLGRRTSIGKHVANDAERRLGVYRHAYRVRLADALRDLFEKTRAWLGDEAFEAAAQAFISARPPTHRNLRWFGAALPRWLDRAHGGHPALAELATIDWQLRQAFDAADAPRAAPPGSDPPQEAWATLRCRFAPSLWTGPLRTNAAALWRALDAHAPRPSPSLLPQPATLLVWRSDWQSRFRTIDGEELGWLARLRRGERPAAVCVDLASRGATIEQAARAGARYLRRWRDDGVVVELVP
jgi:hypothetical protein